MSASGKVMTCDEFKEMIAADPSATTPDGAAHASSCASCAAFRNDMLAFNDRIVRALAIEVPALRMPELPAIGGNEADDNVVSLPQGRRLRMSAPAWLGIAASFALAAIIGVQYVGNERADQALANEILSHIDHEPMALRATNVAVSEDWLASVVNESVGTLDAGVGLITYAQSCIINGRTIPHLVIQGERGPVTLLLMPDEMVHGTVVIDGVGVNGVILPVGKGSIAIVGERDEHLEEIEQRVIDSVEWRI